MKNSKVKVKEESVDEYFFEKYLASELQESNKAFDILLPLVRTEGLRESLAELYDLRDEVKRLKVNSSSPQKKPEGKV